MSNTFRLDVEGLSKKFSTNLKSSLRYGLTDSFRRVLHLKQSENLRNDEFWALDNVSFSLEEGKSLGLMGLNGSGKTTLLRILNGTYKPDKGHVKLRGNIGSLIAAGAGFSPLLTGRENIYVNATLLGMKPKDIENKFDEIVEFSELGKFIDMPVKNYSSGMSVRLGFAVATVSSPKILLVDEVLAVGDLNFQKKCFERLNSMKQEGASIVLVSHSVGAIWSVCDQALVLDGGKTEGLQDVELGCKKYEVLNNHGYLESELAENNSAESFSAKNFFTVKYDGQASKELALGEVDRGKDLVLVIGFEAESYCAKGVIRLLIDSQLHSALSIVDSYEAHHRYLSWRKGFNEFRVRLHTGSLRPGVFTISVSLVKADANVHYANEHNVSKFVVRQSESDFLYADFRASVFIESIFEEKESL